MTFKGFEKITVSGEPLALNTTFGIGGPAEALVTPDSIDEFRDVVAMCSDMNVPLHVLGRGSNLLVADSGVAGVVIATKRLRRIERRGTTIFAEAGAFLPQVVSSATAWGLSGFEPLVGIPGTVGGALVMNAGGGHGTVSSILRTVTIIEPDGSLTVLDRDDVRFGHRDSILKGKIVAQATFELEDRCREAIGDLCQEILRDKKRTQPMSSRSAGCIFRNPPGESAGALIDAAQLKSCRIGDARVSRKHANFIVNRGNARASDVLHLMTMVRRRVADRFSITLEPEVHMWGFDGVKDL